MTPCTARSKRTGQPCQRPAMHGKTVCYHHGGKTPRGHALPQTTHGRYSRDLPTRLAARYQASQTDPDLLNLNAEIALMDARLADLLRRVDTGESGQLWRDLKATYTAMEDAQRAKDFAAVARLLSELGALIRHGHSDYAAWADVRTLVDQRRRLVEAERKRLTEMQQLITAEQAMMLVTRLSSAVRRHVDDPRVLAAISAELGGVVGSDAG